MSFRRIPFQFSTTDPAERQRELEKRFGVPSQNKMYVDATNPLTMGSGFNSSTGSPRFQHRVPMFVDGVPAQSSVDSSACENKSPKVRVIPIEIEKDGDLPSTRHRTFSGPPNVTKQHDKEVWPQKDDASTLKRSMEDLSKPSKMKAASGPRVYNIPIKVEQSSGKEKKSKSEKGKMPAAKSHPKVNGCDVSKTVKTVEPESSPKKPELTEEERMKRNIEESFKKINSVQEELKSYETGVNEFNGTAKDKQYRYLDEMLTRCMIKLDDTETWGSEEVRFARKKVVKMVQACIDLLESKVNIANNPDSSVNTSVTSTETVEKQDTAEQSPVLEEENMTDMSESCNMVDVTEENQEASNAVESRLPKNESLTSDAPSSKGKLDVPEVEMTEVTSTSNDVNQNEKTGVDDLVPCQSQSNTATTFSEEISTQSSDSNEIEMTEVMTQSNNPRDQKELPQPEVSSTDILNPEVSVDPTPTSDSNEAEMVDISSTLNNSSEIEKVEAIPEVSSSVRQPEQVASNIEQFPVETAISENCESVKSVNTEEANNVSNSDVILKSNIPEVEMKEIEDSCKTDNITLDDEQSSSQSNIKSNNEPN